MIGSALLMRLFARRPHYVDRFRYGRAQRGLTLTELRAEYGQRIIDDARADPVLARVLHEIGTTLLESVRTLDKAPAHRPLIRYILLTELANRYLASVTEPYSSIPPSPYRGYSHPMLIVAAACVLGTSRRLRNP
ncbi:hypothetical protein GCM10009557_67180 [Virgisporangium ochraceum]|uniref:Uncharacterized protein n=1 Tax=Virgisporangium ochraceum TaxID=65505 RepID=A0A8J3ZWV4_9ACTN|nr:hypothetical protein [Virgisporangium ochraceum]GIJ71071.1 hypothetical protein Voc01_059880 [Virgisporangium ochraceum]